MPNPLTARRLLALALCLCAGCAVSPRAKKSSAALADQTAAQPDGQASGTASPPAVINGANTQSAASANRPANGNPPNTAAGTMNRSATAGPDPQVLDDVMAQVAELGPIEPEARKQLAEDLRKTDPAYWPMLVKTFRASLEYRRRNTQKATEEAQAVQSAPAAAAQPEIVQVAVNEPITGQGQFENLGVRPPAGPLETKDGLEGRPTKSGPDGRAMKDGLEGRPTGAPAAPSPAPGTPPPAASQSANSGSTMIPAAATAATAGKAAAPDWRRHLDAAITELERQTREHPGDADAWVKQVHLRLLDLAAGRRDDALKPITGVPPALQDYWAKQIFALSTCLDQATADPSRRAAEASLHLARAVAALGEQAPLVVHNLAFCTEVHSYGALKRFEPAEFHAGQQVLLYAEIENFKSEEAAQGFHTSLEASYQIHDRQGQRVTHDDLSLTEEYCQNRRRDFFVRYFITLPKNIYEGDYTLDLTVEDKLGHKINQASIDFSVKAK